MNWRVYVAGGSSERLTVVRPIIDRLSQVPGIEIIRDWTRDPGWDRPSPQALLMAAELDINAIRRADVFWYVAPHLTSEGSHFELGFAMALGKLVKTSGKYAHADFRIFPQLADHHYDTHEEAEKALLNSLRIMHETHN